ncbi:MAG TPA: hypothetical protein VN788_14640 [Verrucomicrobiae bacterium]|nr:hypothetical protein [Verrucomicrobiae bacterium]
MGTTVAFVLVLVFAQTVSAQTNQLNFGENYFVSGDYVVAGVGLRGLGGKNGLATSTLTMPDTTSVPSTGVPAGADIVAAILYWQTVESTQTQFVGQNGFFRPMFKGGPATGYAITGVVLGNPNAPTSWSSGGCSGSAQGSKTIRTYRADVRPFLPQDANGNILAGNKQAPVTYEVSLPDGGKSGATPITLGASLVIIYRALTPPSSVNPPSLPLNSVVIYDGAAAPNNSSSTFSQTIQGFYQAAASPISKLTHIVGNGQNNKSETVSFDGQSLPSLYANLPPFPGFYNGSWDNPTWSFPNANYLNNTNPVMANDSSAITMVAPSASNSGCVSWGAVIVSTTVQDSDKDGLLDKWESDKGYCDASVNEGACTRNDPSWVSLPDADPAKRDIFVQMDYMCSIVNADGTCDTTNGYSFLPDPNARAMMVTAFSNQNVNLHLISTNAIQEPTCTDDLSTNPPALCFFPNQPGVVDWKNGLEFLKEQPLNYPDENSCEQALNGPCTRRFQHGRKDSYHYALFAHASATPSWGFVAGNLTSVVASGTTVTFTTSTPHGLAPNDTVDGNGRVTVIGAISNFNLNGTYYVKTTPTPTTFTIQIANATSANPTFSTDPGLWVFSGQAGTGSGISDVGGADSLISLGSWGADGQSVSVQAGTFMHELGHSLGLTHGGIYYDTQGTYIPTIESNCKANYQSVMSYLFQVDLLDNGVLDYSEQGLTSLNERSLPLGLTTTDGSTLAYSTTKWYLPNAPFGVGTAATHHCDGSPVSSSDVDMTMYRAEGSANPVAPAWVNRSDTNFDGTLDTNLRGYNDWTSVDLRQIGATANDIGSPGISHFGTGISHFGTGVSHFGTGVSHFGTGVAEIDRQTANSFTRPPRKLTATVIGPPNAIQLNWNVPTFGQIATYNIYRGVGTGVNPAPPAYATVAGSQTSFVDTNISCGGTYTYFVTALLSNGQESVASNLVTVVKCGR